MVYAANGGLIIDGTAVGCALQIPTAPTGVSRLRGVADGRKDTDPVYAQHVNEGQGDLLPVG